MRRQPRIIRSLAFAVFAISSIANAHQVTQLAALPITFEPNEGQTSCEFDYLAHAGSYDVGIQAAGVTLMPPNGSMTRLHFVGANAQAPGRIRGMLPTLNNYYGKTTVTGVHSYERVEYDNVHPGIDVVHYSRNHRFEFDFVVRAGADPSRVTIAFDGADPRIDVDGSLVAGLFRLLKPRAFQFANDERIDVAVEYTLAADGNVGFKIGSYDRTRTLTIDPEVAYVTYVEGVSLGAFAADSAGDVYLSGVSGAGVFSLLKLNATGSAPVYITQLPPGFSISAIAPSSAGEAFVVGTALSKINADGTLAWSRDLPSPGTAIALERNGNIVVGMEFSPPNAGTLSDSSVLKTDASGDVIYGPFQIAGRETRLRDVAVDALGYVYAGGSAGSDFPATPGAFSTDARNRNVFVLKLDPTLSETIFSSRFSDDDAEPAFSGGDMGIDAAGNAYVAGHTPGAFPTTPGALFTAPDPAVYGSFRGNVFLTKLSPSGTLLFSTYLQAEQCDDFSCSKDFASDLAVDARGNAWVGGRTNRVNRFPEPNISSSYGVVWLVSPQGDAAQIFNFTPGPLAFSDFIHAVAVDPNGNGYAVGLTSNTALATDGAWITTPPNPNNNIFIWKAVVVATPEQQLAELDRLIMSLPIHGGLKTSLRAKVRAATDSLAREGGAATACNQLNALAHEVRAQTSKKLTTDEASRILTAINGIRAALGCN